MKEKLSTIYNNFLENYSSINWQGIIFPLKIISFILSVFLIIFIFNIFFKIRKNIKNSLTKVTEKIESSSQPKKELDKKWEAIEKRLEKENESDYKLAVIEADNLFDDFLIKMGFKGEDMGERLKQITKQQLVSIDELWQAHKVRNRIAHEQEFKLTYLQAKRAIEIYQQAMENLEV